MHINPDTNFYGTNGAAIPISAILDRIEINSTGRLCDREFEPVPDLPAFSASRRVSLPTMGGR